MIALRSASMLALAGLLAGCGGGGTTGSALPPATVLQGQNKAPVAIGKLTLKLPANFNVAKTASTKRSPAYVNTTTTNRIDVYVNASDVTPMATVTNTGDGTQTFDIPFFSTDAQTIVAVETTGGPGTQILSIGETDLAANSFAPGDAPIVSVTMLMNATAIGLMTDPANANGDASISSTFSYAYCSATTVDFYPFETDSQHGFLTMTGLGTVVPTLTSWTNLPGTVPADPVSVVATGLNVGYAVAINSVNGGVTLNLTALNPASVISYNIANGYSGYPGIAALNSVLRVTTFISIYSSVTATITIAPYSSPC